MTTIEAPRTPTRPAPKRGVNWEKWGWIYMRASGVVLIVLIFTHLFVNLMVGDGVKAIDFGFSGGMSRCSGSRSSTAPTACARS